MDYTESEIDPVFRAVCTHWMKQIEHAKAHKAEVFGKAASECRQFFNGPKDWSELMGGMTGMAKMEEFPDPSFKMNVNKTFEFVTVFGPAMYQANPVRTVRPRMPVVVPPDFFPDPYVYQAVAAQESARIQLDGLTSLLLESYLNWTPNEFKLDREARQAIDEALITGRGCLWTELYSPPGFSHKVVRTLYESVDDLLVDPDADRFENAKWIARKCVHPTWQVERDYGLRGGSLKGNLETQATQAAVAADEERQFDRKRGLTNDLLVYWKIYSKMGIGGRLAGFHPNMRPGLEMFGDYCYVVVAENVRFPLNLSPDVYRDPAAMAEPDRVFGRVAWPTPFWASDAWPVSVLDFHRITKCPWPMPHLKAGMGELKFLNWAMSFLAGRMRTSTRDFIALKKSLGEEIKTAILEGKDFTLLEIEADHEGTISELIQFLDHPQVNGDIWKMIAAVEANFDKRVGLTELMYGQGGATQIRSAQEATLRNENMNVRPEDMAQQVEAWQSEVAAREAVCARYHLTGQDVSSVVGPLASAIWDQYVVSRDLNVVCRQLDYRIESGTTRRPNKQFAVSQANQAIQTIGPIVQQYAMATGDFLPLNNLLADYARAQDLDPTRYQLRMAPPPPPAQPSAEDGGTPGDESAQANGGASPNAA